MLTTTEGEATPILIVREAWLLDLGRKPYREVWELQKALVDRRAEDKIPDGLILVEHDPVATLGRRGTREDVLDPGLEVFEVERGGEATYHGPGQLVGYPILKLPDRLEVKRLEAVREFQDRIADELTRSVIGRLAAALDLEDLEPRVQDVLARPASAEGRDRIVLDKDETVGDLVLRTPIDEGLLELPDLPVRFAPEIQEPRVSDDEDRGGFAFRRREHGIIGSVRGSPGRGPPP